MADYPRRIDKFKTHVDYVDDVEASDINKIQDALQAVEQTIGRNPTRFVTRQGGQTDFGSDGDGGLVGTLPPGYDQADRGTRTDTVDYKSIADRLDALERGSGGNGGNSGLPLFQLSVNAIDIPSVGAGIEDRPYRIKMPTPHPGRDPYNMYNGYGVTLPRDGFWTFMGTTIYQLNGITDGSDFGLYQTAIDVDADWVSGMIRIEHFQHFMGKAIFIKTFREGFFTAGQKILLGTAQNSALTQNMRLAVLSGFMLKEIQQ